MPARSVLTLAVQRIAIFAVLLTCLLLLWIGAQTPVQVVVLLAIIAGAFIRPVEVTLATVAAIPVVKPALAMLGMYDGATAELLVLATGSGWLLRRLVGSREIPETCPPWRAAALVFAAIVAASLIVELTALRVLISPESFWPSLSSEIASYVTRGRSDLAGRFWPVPAAMTLLEGVLVFVVISTLPGGRPAAVRVLQMFVAGASAVATLNIARFAGAVLRSDAPAQAVPELLRSVRISVGFGDVNAAGSFFVLAAFTAAGLAVAARGHRPTADSPRPLAPGPWPLILATVLCGMALWLSGSRAAFLAGIVTAAVWLAWRGGRVARRALPAMAIVALIGIWAFPNPILDRSAVGAMSIRLELARASFRLLSEAPVFGIGIGRFYARSGGEIRDPAVSAIYPRENAHNNFLQILTELGIVGLASFLRRPCGRCSAPSTRYARSGQAGVGSGRWRRDRSGRVSDYVPCRTPTVDAGRLAGVLDRAGRCRSRRSGSSTIELAPAHVYHGSPARHDTAASNRAGNPHAEPGTRGLRACGLGARSAGRYVPENDAAGHAVRPGGRHEHRASVPAAEERRTCDG